MLRLAIGFVVLLVATGRVHGLRALIPCSQASRSWSSSSCPRSCTGRRLLRWRSSALPVLLIFSVGGTSFADAVNGEAVADEVIAALVGSIGLILSMPITTALAALLAPRMSDKQLRAMDSAAHVH